MKSDKKVAGILVRWGLITEEQRAEAIAEADPAAAEHALDTASKLRLLLASG